MVGKKIKGGFVVKKLVTLLLSLMLICSNFTTTAAEDVVKESPYLTAKVEAGELPPLAERIPVNPLVSTQGAVDAVYGGQMELAFNTATSAEYGWMNKAYVLKSDGLGSTSELPVGNLVDDWSVSEDAKVYTFHIREGLKWSDGVPVTTEDVRFWWEDVVNNEAITPTINSMWQINGKLMELEIVDEFTFVCTFADSYILFPWQLSLAWQSEVMFFLPSHYLKNLHIDYADRNQLTAACEAAGYTIDDWAEYYIAYGWGPDGPNNLLTAKIGCPTLNPYVITGNPSVGVYIAERNPYYWEVDELGRQLPYIDTVRITQVADVSTLLMKIMAGEIDYARESMAISDYSMLKQNEANGGYLALPMKSHDAMFWHFNYGYTLDEEWRQIVNTREFRQALNMAIDRDNIIDNVYLDLAEKPTHFPSEYDVDKANELLDAMGMDKRDAEGYRMMPSGKPFAIEHLYAEYGSDFTQVLQIVQQNWADIGIRMTPKIADGSLITQLNNASEIQTRMFFVDFPVYVGNPVMWDWSIPIRASLRYQVYYNTTGTDGEAPEGDVLDIYQKTFAMKAATSLEEVATIWAEIQELLYDSVFWFLPIENKVAPVIYSDRMHNIVENDYMIVSNMNLLYTYIAE